MKRKAFCLILALSLCLTACGSRKGVDDEDDYDMQESSGGSSKSGISVSEMLDGTDLSYSNTFDINGTPASIDVNFSVNDADNLCIYNIEPLSPDDINEDEIVSSIFGDTGKAITPDVKDYLTKEEDSDLIMNMATTISQMNNDLDHLYSDKNCAWIDTDDYYMHTYEGKYNGVDYELLISFSKISGQMITGLYPLRYGDVIQSPGLDQCYATNTSGSLITGNSIQNAIDINEVMADKTNKCTLSDDELINTTAESLYNFINIDYPKEAISLSLDGAAPIDDTESEKNELVFLNDDILGTADLNGAVRDGYQIYVMFYLCNQVTKYDTAGDGINQFNAGYVDINDSGIIDFFMFSKYKFNGLVTDNASILSFEDAMDTFVNESSKECEAADFSAAVNGQISYVDAALVYVPVTMEDGTMQLTPAWELTAFSNKTRLIAVTYVNALDGSYIDSLSAKELGY